MSVAACRSAGSTGGQHTMFEKLWTLRTDGPASSGLLPSAEWSAKYGLFGRDAVDLATGKVLWTADGVALGIDHDRVVVARRSGNKFTAIVQHDLGTGSTLSEATLKHPDGSAEPLDDGMSRLALAPSRLIHSDYGRVAAFATDSGKEVWRHEISSGRARLVVSNDLVGIISEAGLGPHDAATGDVAEDREGELTAHDAATGNIRWRAPVTGDVSASPRGGFFMGRADKVVELDPSGNVVRTIPGRMISADKTLVATNVGRDIVIIDGNGQEIDRIRPDSDKDYVAAAGLCNGAVVYFRSKDSTIWWRDPKRAEKPVVKLYEKVVISTEAGASAGPTLTTAPRCANSILLIQDWYLSAYQIPSP